MKNKPVKDQVVDSLRTKGRKTHEMADNVEDDHPQWAKRLRKKAAMYFEASDYIEEAFR